MVGLNPWPLSRSRFCFIWLELENLAPADVEGGRRSLKGARIGRAFVLKAREGEDGMEIVGKWEGVWSAARDPLPELMAFLSDSYLVALHGNRFVFPALDECLGRGGMPPMDRNYAMDVEEAVGWVEDEEWSSGRLGELRSLWDREAEGRGKVAAMVLWFGRHMAGLLRNGFG